jgi:predicted DNA-binding transcriptional regulator AlpA
MLLKEVLDMHDQQFAVRLIREKEILERTGLSRTQRWRLEREGKFPHAFSCLSAHSGGSKAKWTRGSPNVFASVGPSRWRRSVCITRILAPLAAVFRRQWAAFEIRLPRMRQL